jgi:hypothetical protein
MKSKCDPNGIRTRVTAVKGRCPGPLDDRVTTARAISELLLLGARQIARPDRFLFLLLLLLAPELMNQRCCTRSCTLMFAQNFARAPDEASTRFAITQKVGDR